MQPFAFPVEITRKEWRETLQIKVKGKPMLIYRPETKGKEGSGCSRCCSFPSSLFIHLVFLGLSSWEEWQLPFSQERRTTTRDVKEQREMPPTRKIINNPSLSTIFSGLSTPSPKCVQCICIKFTAVTDAGRLFPYSLPFSLAVIINDDVNVNVSRCFLHKESFPFPEKDVFLPFVL